MRGGLPTAVPTDPTIYHFYEVLQVYGPAIKELIHGHGWMLLAPSPTAPDHRGAGTGAGAPAGTGTGGGAGGGGGGVVRMRTTSGFIACNCAPQ
jgi:Cyanate lyase C-terminal domain